MCAVRTQNACVYFSLQIDGDSETLVHALFEKQIAKAELHCIAELSNETAHDIITVTMMTASTHNHHTNNNHPQKRYETSR